MRNVRVIVALTLMACQPPPENISPGGEPPTCEPSPGARFRLFAVGHKISIEEAESAAAYEAAVRATVEEHVAPLLASDRPNVLVFPESVALSAVLLGPRGAAARQESTAQDALSTLLGSYLDQVSFYARRTSDAGPGRLLLLAVSDPLWRAFDSTFSGIARDYGVYVAAGIDVGDVEVTTDPEVIEIVGDPERPDGPVYWVPSGKVHNQVVFYGPDGTLIARTRKEYLTDMELVDLDLDGGLPEKLGPVDLGGLMRASAMISRDAWMQDALERQALRGTNVLLQNEAYAGGWTVAPTGYAWPPDNLKRSGWAAVQKFPELRVAVAPMLVGNFFDVAFDGQSFAAVPGHPQQTRRALVAQVPDTGWAAIAPWVEDAAAGGETLEEQREALRLVGEALLPGGARDNGYVAGTVYVDVELAADDGYAPVADAQPDTDTPALGTSRAIAPSGMGRQRLAAPVILADGTMAVAWEDSRLCTPQVWMARSLDDGASWSEPVRVLPSQHAQRAPSMVATNDGALLVAWQEVLGGGRAQVRVARSVNAGASWTAAPGDIDEDMVEAWRPALAVDALSGALHLAFVDRRDGNWRVYVTRSVDRGQSWAAPVRVDPRQRTSEIEDTTYTNEWTPAIAAYDDHVVVAYTHRRRPDADEQPSHDVFVIESRDGGATWGEPTSLDGAGFPERLAADVVVALGRDHSARVLWSSLRGTGHDADVALARVPSAGDGLIDELIMAPDVTPARDQWFPSIARVADDAWVVAWQDFRGGSNDIYLARLSAGGFGPALRVDDAGASAAQSWRPRVAARPDGTVLVVWEDSRSGHAELRAASATLP